MSEPMEAYPRGRAEAPGLGAGDARDTGAAAEAAVEATWPVCIRSGDAAAFEAMVRRYAARLRLYAERHVHASSLAEEIVEDVFVDIWERRAGWNVQTSVRRYLYGAVRKAALVALRNRRNRDRIHRSLREGGRAPAMAQPEPSPDERIEAQQLAARFQDAIDALPDRSREAFLLARQHELSHAEIAEVMGISTSTIEKHIGRAMRELRETLAVWMAESS